MQSTANIRNECDYIYDILLGHIVRNNFSIIQECIYDYSDINVNYLTEIQNRALRDISDLAANQQNFQHPQRLFNLIATIRNQNNSTGLLPLLNDYRQFKGLANAYYLTLAAQLENNNHHALQHSLDIIYQQPNGEQILNAIKMRAIRLAKMSSNQKAVTGLFVPAAAPLALGVNNHIVQYVNEKRSAIPLRHSI